MDQAHPLFKLLNEIGIVAQLSGRIFESVMPEGMTLAQFTVLNHFYRLGGERTPAALADAFQVTRATMSSTLRKLEAKGFVSVAPDAEDGRSKRVALTEAGRKMRDSCVAALGPEIVRVERKLSGADFAAMLPQLARLRQVLDADRDGR
jgi:DNA-binding MarR family transcriptional regulator